MPITAGISREGDAFMVAIALEERRLRRPPSQPQVQSIRRRFPHVSDTEAAGVIAAMSADARHRCAPGADAWLHLVQEFSGGQNEA